MANIHKGYAGMQAKRGVPVFSREFEHSAHVEHFRRYPAEYREEIEAFLAALTQAVEL